MIAVPEFQKETIQNFGNPCTIFNRKEGQTLRETKGTIEMKRKRRFGIVHVVQGIPEEDGLVAGGERETRKQYRPMHQHILST